MSDKLQVLLFVDHKCFLALTGPLATLEEHRTVTNSRNAANGVVPVAEVSARTRVRVASSAAMATLCNKTVPFVISNAVGDLSSVLARAGSIRKQTGSPLLRGAGCKPQLGPSRLSGARRGEP